MKPVAPEAAAPRLLGDIRQLIEQSRRELAATVNSALTLLYWHIGRRIRTEVLGSERATYGEQIVSALSRQLEADYGRGFSAKNLRHMLRFAESFPSADIVSAVRRQLSWTHIKTLIYIDDPLKRDFYLQMCQQEGRTLQDRLDSQLFERTALSRQPEQLLAHELATLRQTGAMTPALVLKDPYVLDFLGLSDRYLEKDLEDAILRELENFLLELGAGFTFVARQKRIQIDNDDFYIDLLLYNRRLKRLVAIELKLGRLQGRRQRPDGALPALASQTRARAGRSATAGHHPVRRQETGADRIAGAGRQRHPRRRIPHHPATQRSAASQTA